MNAYVLIRIRPGTVPEALNNMRRIKGIKGVNMTFGPYDAVAVVEAKNVSELGELIATEIQPIPGVLETMTCLVVDD